MLNILERLGVVVDLDHAVLVDAVDRAVCAVADLLCAGNGYDAIGLLHGHHFREAGHIEDLVDLGIDVDDPQLRMLLSNAQDHTQPGGGDIFQVLRVEYEIRLSRDLRLERLLHLRGVGGVNPAFDG